RAESVSIASNGANACVAWTEYLAVTSQESETAPQSYVDCWSGTAWAQYGGSINVNSSDSAYSVGIRWLAGQPYVAIVERSASGLHQLFLRTTADSGATWTTVANGSSNCTPPS